MSGPSFESGGQSVAQCLYPGRLVVVHQQPLRAGTCLLIEAADFVHQVVQRLRACRERGDIGEADAMAPINPATATWNLFA
ncbi:hypothetical protein D3C71_2148980 [compost metagenome]